MTLNTYSSLCDDFYLDMYINTELDLPTERDTILAFFERIQKQYPSMGCFYRRGKSEFCLEENRNLGQYRWISLETLSVNHLDIDSLDVTFAMDFDFAGSHDEVIAEALLGQSAFNCLLDMPDVRPIGFSPAIVVALSENDHTQARISIESKTSVFEPEKKGQSEGEAICLSLTIRQYPPAAGIFDPLESFENQCRLAQEFMDEKIVPNFVQPLTETIAQKRLK